MNILPTPGVHESLNVTAPVIISLALLIQSLSATASGINGTSEIRGPAGGSEIVIRTSDRTAGAICSLTWNGKEFIDAADHGRELQSASNFDMDGDIKAETFNPTEAGSCRDGAGEKTTSRLLFLRTKNNELITTNQMAFWLTPAERSGGISARNTNALSNHLLGKHVRIGMPGLPNAIDYDVRFTIPGDEKHVHGVFEALTGYMPPEFNVFKGYNPTTRKLEDVGKGPGEQPLPLIFSTQDGNYAMGIYAPPNPNASRPGYGRWDFGPQMVTKWNCVYRESNREGLRPGPYTYHMIVIVGTLEEVRGTMDIISRRSQ